MDQARSPLEAYIFSGTLAQLDGAPEGTSRLAYCYICQTVTSEPLVKNPTNHRKVLASISERASYGDLVYSQIYKETKGIPIPKLISASASFHGSCYRKTVHPGNCKRIKEQYYRMNPRKRPNKLSINSGISKISICLFCNGLTNYKNNLLQTKKISPSGIKQLRQTIVRNNCSKFVIDKLQIDYLNSDSSLSIKCHEMCWKKHVSKTAGSKLSTSLLKPNDLAEEDFMKYVNEKFTISKSISISLLIREYHNILKKHNSKLRLDVKKVKQLLKARLPGVVIRKGRKGCCDMVSLVDANTTVSLQKAENIESCTQQYSLRRRSLGSVASTASHGIINMFPDELLLHIFTYMTTEEIAKSVLPVCRRWRQVGWDPILWKHVHVTRDELSRRHSVLNMLKRSPKLQTLSVSENPQVDAPDITDIIRSTALNCPKLTSIDAPHRPAFTIPVMQILEASCPLIEHVNFENFIDNRTLIDPSFLHPLVNLKNLKTLIIGHTRFGCADLVVRQIAEHCKKMVKLDISGFLIHDDTFRHLLNKQQKNLLSLAFSPSIWNKSFRLITGCKLLEELRLKVGYHARACEEQLSCLKELKNLKALQLQFVDLPHNAELMHLYRNPSFRYLERVEVTGYHDDISNDFLNVLGLSVPQLKELTLTSQPYITDVGFGKLLNRCRQLTNLKLVEMDELTGSSIVKYVRYLPHLKKIEVIRCPRISSLLINQLRMRKTLKNVDIIWESC